MNPRNRFNRSQHCPLEAEHDPLEFLGLRFLVWASCYSDLVESSCPPQKKLLATLSFHVESLYHPLSTSRLLLGHWLVSKEQAYPDVMRRSFCFFGLVKRFFFFFWFSVSSCFIVGVYIITLNLVQRKERKKKTHGRVQPCVPKNHKLEKLSLEKITVAIIMNSQKKKKIISKRE